MHLSDNAIKNILIIRLSAIGDVLKCTAVIEKLKDRFPGSSISWLVESKSKGVLVGNSNIDELIVWERKEWSRKARESKDYLTLIKHWWNFIQQIKKRRFDLVVDLHGLPRSQIISHFSGAKWRFCYTGVKYNLDKLSNIRINPDKRLDQTALHYYAGVLRPLGIDTSHLSMAMPVLTADHQFAEKYMQQHKLREGKFIVINPSTSWKSKCWPVEYYADLADKIIERYRLPVVIFGGPGDLSLAQQLVDNMKYNVINAAGKTTLRQLAAITQKAAVFISGDTGPLFIAEAVGAATISIFGPTNPCWHAPQGPKHINLSASNCSCNNSMCDNMKCLKEIKPEMVFMALERLLKTLKLPA